MTKLELKEWITELACSLDRGDLKIDELMNEVEEIVDKNVTEQLTLTDVVGPKGTCCLKPKKIGKVNDMFESWDECKNCGKEVL